MMYGERRTPYNPDWDRAWHETIDGMACRMCGRSFARPAPHLHPGRGVRRWAVGFSQASARKGLSRALRVNHRRACAAFGPMLPLTWRYARLTKGSGT